MFKIISLKILFGYTTISYASTRSSGHHQSFFLILNFLTESLKANKKLTKKITDFTI